MQPCCLPVNSPHVTSPHATPRDAKAWAGHPVPPNRRSGPARCLIKRRKSNAPCGEKLCETSLSLRAIPEGCPRVLSRGAVPEGCLMGCPRGLSRDSVISHDRVARRPPRHRQRLVHGNQSSPTTTNESSNDIRKPKPLGRRNTGGAIKFLWSVSTRTSIYSHQKRCVTKCLEYQSAKDRGGKVPNNMT